MPRKRLYALFERQDGKLVRLSKTAYYKETAVRVFQSALLAHFLGESKWPRELRPVKE